MITAPFWAGVERGELLMQWCPACSSYQWTPQLACASCLGEDLGWRKVSGRGSVYSYSVVWRPQSEQFVTPYVVTIIALAEGPRILSNLVEVPFDEVRIGMPVTVRFEHVGGPGRYVFVPAGTAMPTGVTR